MAGDEGCSDKLHSCSTSKENRRLMSTHLARHPLEDASRPGDMHSSGYALHRPEARDKRRGLQADVSEGASWLASFLLIYQSLHALSFPFTNIAHWKRLVAFPYNALVDKAR